MNRIGEVRDRRILLLQGPMGTFFKRLDRRLRRAGAQTYRIGFNAGDRFFSYGDNYTSYRGTKEEWESFVGDFLQKHRIDMIFLFGDCRFYQATAIRVAQRMGIEVFVFEEGYVRPHYITMERWGVNDYSHLSRDPDFYRRLESTEPLEPQHARQSKTKMVLSATAYYAVANLFAFRYPHYQHHRDFSAVKEAFYGIRGAIRKLYYPLMDNRYGDKIKRDLHHRYYFVPLQTHNDFQILQHSPFQSIEKFIITVLESFAVHAPKDHWIVFKHHPVDRGRRNYERFIREQAGIVGVQDRVIVVHDLYLPDCLRHACATVTVNSTVGLTSIGYGIPTITLGNAIYNIEGLTNKGLSLDRFWTEFKKPDLDLYRKFRNYIIDKTQLNGSFYGLFPVEFDNGEIFLVEEASNPSLSDRDDQK